MEQKPFTINWNQLDQSGWNALLPSTATALQQSWHYGASLQAMGKTMHRAVIHDRQGPVAIAQILCRPFCGLGQIGLMSRGPVWLRNVDQRKAVAQLRKSLPGRGVTLLLATPETQAAGAIPLMTPCTLATLPLSRSLDQMRQGMKGKWRNRLRHAEKSNVQITHHNDSQTLNWLLDKDCAQQRQKGYRSHSAEFLQEWCRSGHSHKIYVARDRGNVFAAMLFLDHAPGVTYQIGWSSALGRKVSAHNLILWHAMRDYAQLGCANIDLGSVDTTNAPGLARFKIGAGAKLCELGATGLVLPLMRRGLIRATRYGGKGFIAPQQ